MAAYAALGAAVLASALRAAVGGGTCPARPSGDGRPADGDHLALLQHRAAGARALAPRAPPGASAAGAPRIDVFSAGAAAAGPGARRLQNFTTLIAGKPLQPFTNAKFQPVMDDVYGAFNAIEEKSDTLQVWTGDSAFLEGSYSKGHMPYEEHFQGIQRVQDTTYMYITGSGKTAESGQFFVVNVPSRPKVGPLGRNYEEAYHPPENDAVAKVVNFDSEYWHAGGSSSFGNYFVVGAEDSCGAASRMFGSCNPSSRVHFFDTSDPGNPRELPYKLERNEKSAGAVALTQEADGRFLLLVARADSAIMDFYRSTSTTSLDTDPGFEHFATWRKEEMLVMAGQSDDFLSYQSLGFVRQKDGTIFLMGTTRSDVGLGKDYADLFMVDNTAADRVSLEKVGRKHLSCKRHTCNMYAGGGVYVASPSTLQLYATEWEPFEGEIWINEFANA